MAGFMGKFSQGNETVIKRKKVERGSARKYLFMNAQDTLKSGVDLQDAVKLPSDKSTSLEEWIAVHVDDFFNRAQLVYDLISSECTVETCPEMAGGTYQYRWQDDENYKKPTSLPAQKYIENLFKWIFTQMEDERIFPVTVDQEFPKNFKKIASKILTRLFRIFVHVYIHHFTRLKQLGGEPHTNAFFKHYYFFVTEFGLVKEKEFEPLHRMVNNLCLGAMADQ